MSTNVKADPFLFLRKFVRHGVQVASVAPSSRQLAEALCQHIDPNQPQLILELGAGTGAVTAVALTRMHPASRLLAVERDADFAQILRHNYPRAEVIEADAVQTRERLAAMGVQQVDVVISGLPVPSLPRPVNEQIFTCVRDIASQCYFSQLTVMPWVYQRLYKGLFHEVTFTPVWQNIPPGGAYHCRRLRDNFASALP